MVAVFERLKEEVRRSGAPLPDESAPLGEELAARSDAERLWAVAVDVPIGRYPGPRGRAVYVVKRFLRKLMSWYVGPFAADQRGFNHAALRLVDELNGRLGTIHAESGRQTEALATQLAELEERLIGLERRSRESSSAPPGRRT